MAPVWTCRHVQATEREGPGCFREHDIQSFPGGMWPPSWTDVPMLMRDWIAAAQAVPEAGERLAVERLADLHARFEQIHPFLDGNGRRVGHNASVSRPCRVPAEGRFAWRSGTCGTVGLPLCRLVG